jgi:alpha-glucosidase (family GH31 glycosyl hydrolase)
MRNGKDKPISRMFSAMIILSMIASYFTAIPAMARDSEFTRQGAGPMYWISYEHQFTNDTFMPEGRWKANIDWMATNFKPYGYDMVSTDGWIEGATMLNRNGYILAHNDSWITNPIGEVSQQPKVYGLTNGDFEAPETTGWTFTGPASHGRNTNQGNHSLWTWNGSPYEETISQKINLVNGQYRVSAIARTKNGMLASGVNPEMRVKGYDVGDPAATVVNAVYSESWSKYSTIVNVTSGVLDLEFYYNSIPQGKSDAGLDLDDVKVEPVTANYVVNGDFEQNEQTGWIYSDGYLKGRNSEPNAEVLAGNSLWTWNWEPVIQTVTQSVYVPNGQYQVSANAIIKNDMDTNGSVAKMIVTDFDSTNAQASVARSITSKEWVGSTVSTPVNVTNGKLTIQFNVDSKGNGGINLDDVSVIPTETDPFPGYAEDLYPNGHTWKYWGDYAHNKGMKMGIYYNPLWVSPEVVKHPDKYKVAGTDTPVADLVIKDANGDPAGGDRFNGGQGNARSLYWLNVDHPLAKQYLQGYIDYFKAQGADFLRVDFLSWYETGMDAGIGKVGSAHRRDQYENTLKWMSEETSKDNMTLSLVMPALKNHGELEQKYGDMIRIDEDVFTGGWDHVSGRRQTWQDNWSQWANEFQGFTGFSDRSGRGGLILDGDFMRMNRFSGSYADNERQSEVSLMTIAGSPLTIADQYDTIGDNAKFYQNPEMIELNKLGLVGKPIYYSNADYKNNTSRDSERWAGQLPDGSWVVGLFNRSDTAKAQTIDFAKDLGIKGDALVRDLWKHQDLGYKTLYSEVLDPHASVVLKVIPKTTIPTYQAEVASYMGGAIFNNTNSGFSGFGYIEGLNQVGSKVTFAINAPKAGDYSLDVIHANGTGSDSSVTLSVYDANDVTAPVKVGSDSHWTFATQADWTKWAAKEQTIQLHQGLNLVTLEHGASDVGEIKLDSIQVKSGQNVELVNGDFESGNHGWTVDNVSGSVASGVDANDAYEGSKRYMYFANPGEATSSQTLSNIPNGAYRISAQVKYMPHLDAHRLKGGTVELRGIQTSGTEKTDIAPYIINDTPSDATKGKYDADHFAYQKVTLDAHVTTNNLTVQFDLNAAVGDTSLQIDNVEIESIDPNQSSTGLTLNNSSFDNGFTNWSRTNIVNQSINTVNSNSFAVISGNSGNYASDLWQYAVAPKSGSFTVKAKAHNHGNFANASLYVSYTGGIQKMDVPVTSDWSDITLPSVQLKKGEVVKVGLLANGQTGSTLDLDDIQVVENVDPINNNDIRFLGNYQSHTVSDDHKSVLFQLAGTAKVKLEFIKDGIAKVWMEPKGLFEKKSSFVVKNEAAVVAPTVSDEGDYIKVQTPALTIRANKIPFRLDYYNAANTELITGERTGGGLGYTSNDSSVYQYMKTDDQEHFYGLGIDRDAQSLDRKGKRIIMNNTMSGGYGGNTSDVSGTFFTSTKGYGIYFDNTQQNATFDMAKENANYYYFSSPNGEMLYYFLAGDTQGSLQSVMNNYSSLTGTAPLPPKWALGYIQSKFGYKSWDETNTIVDTFRNKDIPVDGIVLDAYWAANNHYFDFTWSNGFADPAGNMAALKQKGIKISTLVDPYVQITANSFKEADQKGYFVKDAYGKTIIYDAWYGNSGLVDFTNPAASKWYTDQVKTLYDAGVRGWWIDLNEPERGTDSLRDQFMGGNAGEIRNVYALSEAKAFYVGQRSYTNDRVWSLARSGFSGIQSYGTTVWSGDNDTSWDAFTHNLQLGLSSGMSGIPYFTNDTGGFNGAKPSDELYGRWMQAAAFMPVFRAHGEDSANTGKGSREPWAFPTVENIVKDTIQQRYRMLPYIYSAANETLKNNTPIMRALVMDNSKDSNVFNLQDEWMFGKSMLVAPVHVEGAKKRDVYLPEGNWYDWNGNNVYTGGTIKDYSADSNKIPVFVKEGAIIPLRQDENYVGEKPDDYLNLKVYPHKDGSTLSFTLYEDDGNTYSYEKAQSATTLISTSQQANNITLNIAAMTGSYTGKVDNRVWAPEVKVIAEGKSVYSVKRNGKELMMVNSKDAVAVGVDVWFYDSSSQMLYVKTEKVATLEAQQIVAATTDSGQSAIRDAAFETQMHHAGVEQEVHAAVSTYNVQNGTAVTATLLKNGTPVIGVQQAAATIADNTANLTVTIPATIPAGSYQVRLSTAGVSLTKDYIILSRMLDSFTMESSFNLSKLEANKYLEASVTITNKLTDDKNVMLITALYDENGGLKMVTHSSSSSLVKAGQTLQLNAGFNLPANVNQKKVKVMVWEGKDLSNTTMMPLADVVELTP